MNDCVNDDIRDVLPELLNGTLPAGEVARVQQHVRECAECAAELELLGNARAAMRLASPMDTTRIAAAVQASTAQRLAARKAPARVARIAGLSLIVVAGAAGLWSTRESSPVDTQPRVTTVPASAVQPNSVEQQPAVVEPRAARGPVQLALGGDMSQLEDDQLVALMNQLSALEAVPVADPASLAIEPVMPVDLEEL